MDKSDLLQALRIERVEPPPPAPVGAAAPGQFWAFGAISLVALALGGAAGWFAKPQPPPRIVAAPPAESAAPPRTGTIAASGYVVARRAATVAAEVTGRVLEVRIEEGQTVQAGEVIAILEPTIARAERDGAVASAAASAAELAEARHVMDRTKALADLGYASRASVTTAEAGLEAARARAQASRSTAARAAAQLARYQIRAPFAGVVTNKAAQPGEIISPVSAGGGFTRTGICTIVDMQSLEIEVDVSESFIARIREGARVEAVLDAYPDETFPAHVIAVIPAANRERASFRVRIAFDALDPRILPEMGVKVTVLETA